MRKNRRLIAESLENRRLLVASIDSLAMPTHDAIATEFCHVNVDLVDGGQESIRTSFVDSIAPRAFPHVGNLAYGPDLVQEVDGQIYVVDQDDHWGAAGTLFVFQRDENGDLASVAEVDLGHHVTQMFVGEGTVTLLASLSYGFPMSRIAGDDLNDDSAEPDHEGQPSGSRRIDQVVAPVLDLWNPTTLVMTIDVADPSSVVQQEFDGGQFQVLEQSGNELTVRKNSFGIHPLIFPPVEMSSEVVRFDMTTEGLVEKNSVDSVSGWRTEIVGDTVISVDTDYGWDRAIVGEAGADNLGHTISMGLDALTIPPPISFINRASLGDEGIQDGQKLSLGRGHINDLLIREAEQSAIVIRTDYWDGQATMWVDLIDLSGEAMVVLESIELSRAGGQVLIHGENQLLLRHYDTPSLTLIDLSSETDSQQRVSEIDLPSDVLLGYQSIQLDGDRVVIAATETTPDGSSGKTFWGSAMVNALVTIMPGAETPVVVSSLENVIHPSHLSQLVVIDAEARRLGFIGTLAVADDAPTVFVFGGLNDIGQFEADGHINVGRWLEMDVNSDRLAVRTPDQIIQYGWDSVDNPTITPIGDPVPTFVAEDDAYTVTNSDQDQFLDVLANDNLRYHWFGPSAEIVELVGAPEGAVIVDGHLIKIPAEAIVAGQNFEFQYVASDGQTRSTATVVVTVEDTHANKIDAWVEAIVQQAAADLDVSVSEIEVVSVSHFISDLITDDVDADGDGRRRRHAFDWNHQVIEGVHVVLDFPGGHAIYNADSSGRIEQLEVIRHDEGEEDGVVVDLSLQAVNDNGDRIDQIPVGAEFWIEFTAEDLRTVKSGVFAAFFDLELDNESIELTGEYEVGDGYREISAGGVVEGSVDDLGVVSNATTPIESAGSQTLLRLRAKAAAEGTAVLTPSPADAVGTETLLFGVNDEIPEDQVRYSSLSLVVIADSANPMDTNGDGELTPVDALGVINVLSRHNTPAAEIVDFRSAMENGESDALSMIEINHLEDHDVNRDGRVSLIDALVVVNQLSRHHMERLESQSVGAGQNNSDDEDDDENESAIQDHPSQLV